MQFEQVRKITKLPRSGDSGIPRICMTRNSYALMPYRGEMLRDRAMRRSLKTHEMHVVSSGTIEAYDLA